MYEVTLNSALQLFFKKHKDKLDKKKTKEIIKGKYLD